MNNSSARSGANPTQELRANLTTPALSNAAANGQPRSSHTPTLELPNETVQIDQSHSQHRETPINPQVVRHAREHLRGPTNQNAHRQELATMEAIARVHSERQPPPYVPEEIQYGGYKKRYQKPPTASLIPYDESLNSGVIANGKFAIVPGMNVPLALVNMPESPGQQIYLPLDASAPVSNFICRKKKIAIEKDGAWKTVLKTNSMHRHPQNRTIASDGALEAPPMKLLQRSREMWKKRFEEEAAADPGVIHLHSNSYITRFELPRAIVVKKDLQSAAPWQAKGQAKGHAKVPPEVWSETQLKTQLHLERPNLVFTNHTAKELTENAVLYIPHTDACLRSSAMSDPFIDLPSIHDGGLLNLRYMHIRSCKWFWVTMGGEVDVEKSMIANSLRRLAATDSSRFEGKATRSGLQKELKEMHRITAHSETLNDDTLFSATLKNHGRAAAQAQNAPSHLDSRKHRRKCRNNNFIECPKFCSHWNTLLFDLMSASHPLPDDDKFRWDENVPFDNAAAGRHFMRNVFIGPNSQANVFRAMKLMERGYRGMVNDMEEESKKIAPESSSKVPKRFRKIFKRKTSNARQKAILVDTPEPVSLPAILTRRMFIDIFLEKCDDEGSLTTTEKCDLLRKIAKADGFNVGYDKPVTPLEDLQTREEDLPPLPLACGSGDVTKYNCKQEPKSRIEKIEAATCSSVFEHAVARTEEHHRESTALQLKVYQEDAEESCFTDNPEPELKAEKLSIVEEEEPSPLMLASAAPKSKVYSEGNELPAAPASRPSSTYDQDTTPEEFSSEQLAAQQSQGEALCATTGLQAAGRPSSVLGVLSELTAAAENDELDRANLAARATAPDRTSFLRSFLPRSMHNKRSESGENSPATRGIGRRFKKIFKISRRTKSLPEAGAASNETAESSVDNAMQAGNSTPADTALPAPSPVENVSGGVLLAAGSTPVAAAPPDHAAFETVSGDAPSPVSQVGNGPPTAANGSSSANTASAEVVEANDTSTTGADALKPNDLAHRERWTARVRAIILSWSQRTEREALKKGSVGNDVPKYTSFSEKFALVRAVSRPKWLWRLVSSRYRVPTTAAVS